jgi:hypothetical protein
MPQRGWPVVMCPDCKVPMGVKAVLQGTDCTEVVYICEICRTERPRLKKPPTLPSAPSDSPRPRAPDG